MVRRGLAPDEAVPHSIAEHCVALVGGTRHRLRAGLGHAGFHKPRISGGTPPLTTPRQHPDESAWQGRGKPDGSTQDPHRQVFPR
jgi:hypothetical protein